MSPWTALLRILEPLRYRDAWVTRSGGMSAAFVLGVVGLAIAVGFGWHWSLKLVAFPGVFVTSTLCWWLARGVYWRTGRGRKIAVAYEGHRVPPADWSRTLEELARLVEDAKLDHAISLRQIPRRLVDTDEKSRRARRRYGFSMVLRIEVSPSSEKEASSQAGHFQVCLTSEFARGIEKQALAQVAQLHAELLSQPPPKDLLGVLRYRAKTIFEPIVLWLGVVEFLEGNHDTASRFFSSLDGRLRARCKEHEKPRVSIRKLDSLALFKPSWFPGATPPGPDGLRAATLAARKNVRRYGAQFPAVRLALARDLFYENELEEALKYTTEALEFPLAPEPKRIAVLHVAVLNLLLDRFENAAEAFEELKDSGELPFFDWKDLMGFADFAYELGHNNGVFLQALYRRFAAKVDGSLESRALTWLQEDASRNRLRRFLLNAKPAPKQGSGAAKAKTKKKGPRPGKGSQGSPARKKRKRRRKR